jgi:hypothetical protein
MPPAPLTSRRRITSAGPQHTGGNKKNGLRKEAVRFVSGYSINRAR